MNSKTNIVVNADDFGMSSDINGTILRSFHNDWISTTTIMCNMPGFDEACEINYENNLAKNIGIHLNITEGKPLTEKIKRFSRFVNPNGEMYKSFKGNFLPREEKEAIAEEMQAQIDRYTAKGFKPTHLDSHHHSHHFFDTGKIVIDLAKRNNIFAVRLRFNWSKLSLQRRAYSALYNARIGFAGLAKTKYFCEVRSVSPELLKKNVPVEIMVHPYPGVNGNIVNYKNGKNFEEIMNKYLPERNFVTYDFLIKKNA